MVEKITLEKVDTLLNLNRSNEITTEWTKESVFKSLNIDNILPFKPKEHSELLAFLYQGAGMKLDGSISKIKELYNKSYNIWKVVYYQREDKSSIELKQLFYMISNGLLSDSFAEVRMILNELKVEKYISIIDEYKWDMYLTNTVYILMLILIRKQNGWEDIERIDSIIKNLQIKQKEIEEEYYQTLKDDSLYSSLCWSAALLNIIEAIEIYKNYILTGKPDNVEKVIKRFCSDANDLFGEVINEEGRFLVVFIEKILVKLVAVSLWSSISGISEKLDEYIENLTNDQNSNPIFELWPSQKEAIARNLFDNNKTAVVVQMPTSAGKTLLAKFYILQTMNLYTKAKVAYIVPTRALVNQVRKDLQCDLRPMGLKVEVAIPYADIEELENELLLKRADVIVTTPEKLDILLKVKHPIVQNLKLIVVDEAHGLQESNRGAKLELLLSMLRKDNRSLRVLMLSPFIENSEEISSWLGSDRGHNIYVDWKPAQQFPGMYFLRSIKKGEHIGEITYIPSALNTMFNEKFVVPIHEVTNKNVSKIQSSVIIAKKYSRIGGVLVLCTTKKYAEEVIIKLLDEPDLIEERLLGLESLLMLVSEELGTASLLYKSIMKGYAYHHSALPLVIREEIEEAIAKRQITIVAATTTLAQGMNFPISTVIFQGMSIYENGVSRCLLPSEFWNIAGRAGRALVDKEGHIISVCKNENDCIVFEKILSQKNQEVVSSLLKIIQTIPENEFSLNLIREKSGFSALLQYIYHTVLVTPDIEVEDVLRGSLVYYQLLRHGQGINAEKLVKLTKNYLDKITNDIKRPKLMELIDKTGLSSVSMHFLLRKINEFKLKIDSQYIFDVQDTELSKIIEVVNEIPEINLGLGNTGEFNAELVANITKSWVNGMTIHNIAVEHLGSSQEFESLEEKMSKCGEYLYGKLINNLPWGIAAIQRLNGINSTLNDENDVLIPSYIYFGVKTKEAVAFSMLGVPRFAAEAVGRNWRQKNGEIDKVNVDALEKWLENSTLDDWKNCFSKKETNKGELAFKMWKKNNY